MSDEPKKRGRPRKNKDIPSDKVEKLISTDYTVDISKINEMQKRELLKKLNEELGIKEPEETTRRRKVKVFENTFVDDKTLCVEDSEFTKKVKFYVSERARKDPGIPAKCENCKKEYIKYGMEYLCNDCGSSKK